MSRTRKLREAVEQDERLPPPPRRPAPDECCKSDCVPCVFELYEDELERWERRVAEIRARRAADNDAAHRH